MELTGEPKAVTPGLFHTAWFPSADAVVQTVFRTLQPVDRVVAAGIAVGRAIALRNMGKMAERSE